MLPTLLPGKQYDGLREELPNESLLNLQSVVIARHTGCDPGPSGIPSRRAYHIPSRIPIDIPIETLPQGIWKEAWFRRGQDPMRLRGGLRGSTQKPAPRLNFGRAFGRAYHIPSRIRRKERGDIYSVLRTGRPVRNRQGRLHCTGQALPFGKGTTLASLAGPIGRKGWRVRRTRQAVARRTGYRGRNRAEGREEGDRRSRGECGLW